MTDELVRHKDFSLSPDPVTFTIAPDTFVCYPEIPLDALAEMAKLAQRSENREEQLSKIYDFFDGIMEPDSAARFRRRGRRSTPAQGVEGEPGYVPADINTHPIGMRHAAKIMPWLLEVYGLRPTQESSESSDGSEPTSTSSTDGASDEESTT